MTVVAVVAFIAGTRSDELYRLVGPVLGISVPQSELATGEIEQTYKTLYKYYDGKLDADALSEGASRGLVEAAGDSYTTYLSKEQADEFEKELSGDIGGGIGAEIGVRKDVPTIIRVLDNHPAKNAGLQAGDVIAEVNGEASTKWTVDEVVDQIRGEEGTSVKLSVLRGNDFKDFEVTRKIIKNPSVVASVRDGIGILRVDRFDDETGTLVRAEAQKLKQQNVSGVVLDLRGNGGGYVTAAQSLAGVWLDGKVIMREKRDGKEVDTISSTGARPVLAGTPLVILINGGSASASEIIAGAFKEYGVATLIGEKTFGKGSVQQVVDLPNGAKLKVTIAKWYTPEGTNITKEGIKPDKAVELTADDANNGRDPQLDAALKQLGR